MTLFDTFPARRSDPVTSRLAAAEMLPKLQAERRFACDCVRKYPGATARELDAAFAPQSDGRIRKRLKECEAAGLVRRGEKRVCRVSGMKAFTWIANETP